MLITFLTFGCCLCIGEPLQHSSPQRPAGGQGTGGSRPGRRSLLPGREALPCSPRRPSHGRQSSRNSLRRESSPRGTFFWRCRDLGHPWCCSPASAELQGRGLLLPTGSRGSSTGCRRISAAAGTPLGGSGVALPSCPPCLVTARSQVPTAEQFPSAFPLRGSAWEGDTAPGSAGSGLPPREPSTQPCSPEGAASGTPLCLAGPREGGRGQPRTPGWAEGTCQPAPHSPPPHLDGRADAPSGSQLHRGQSIGPAPGVEDHLLRSGIGPRAAGEPTRALPVSSSMDAAMGAEFSPVWPLDAGGGRTWLRCHVLQLGTSRHGVSPCETPRPARTDGCRGKDTVCCRQHAASTAWVKRELKKLGGVELRHPLCVCGRTCCTQQRPSLPDGIFLLDTTRSAPERRADAPVQPSCLQKPFRHPFLSQPAS